MEKIKMIQNAEMKVLGENIVKKIDNKRLNISYFADKIKEESKELEEAILKYKEGRGTKGHVIEESFDCIQVAIAILDKLNVDVKTESTIHNYKLYSRGWKFKKNIKIQIEEDI